MPHTPSLKKSILSFQFKTLIFIAFTFSQNSNAQDQTVNNLDGKVQFMREVPSLASQIRNGTFLKVDRVNEVEEINPKQRTANQVVPGKGFPKDGDPLLKKQQQKSKTSQKKIETAPIRVFEANTANFTPSDPTGAVGPNHYVAGWNSGFKIYDKQGNLLVDEASLGTLFEGNTAGDPIILYDAPADRFIITEFEDEDEGNQFENGFNIAVCKGSDPVNDGWYIYTVGFETGVLPDYPKYSVWHDGYYITSNIETSATSNKAIFVMEREKMLAGENEVGFQSFPLPTLRTNGFYSPQFFNISSPNGPSSGPATVVYFQDDSWSGINEDHLKLWSVNVDWTNPDNSSISQPTIIKTSNFNSVFDGGSFSNLPQPSGPDIDALQGTVMNQAQYRKFSDHNSAIFNFVVNVAPDGQEQAGIRWYELRQTADGEPWSIFQEGTYVSPTGNNAFAASMAMDESGNIGMGYSTVSSDQPVTINYTGRYSNDSAGEMSVAETLLAASDGVSNSERYADYTHLTVDPVNGKTFWFISEYFKPSRKDVVGVFKLVPDYSNDVQVIAITKPQDGALSDSEAITITIRNAGLETQTSFPVSYSIDGGTPVTETFTGSIAFNETASYTFTQTGDFSNNGQFYSITASTELETDENTTNDAFTEVVQNLWQNDIGVSALITPKSGSGLSSNVSVAVTITNYGTENQSNFPVFYNVNSGATITETFSASLPAQSSATYTFSTTEDFSNTGTYTIISGTNLTGDSDPANDSVTTQVVNSYCQPVSDCDSFGDGVTQINLEGTSITTACSASGFSADLNTTFNLDVNEDPFTGQLQVGYEDSDYVIFIDFNNNGGFEASEQVSQGTVAVADTDTEFTLDLPEGVALGTYRMRVRGKDNNEAGDLEDPCGDLAYGRTNDYSVRIFNSLSVEENIFPESELVIIEPERNLFQISLSTNTITEKLAVTVYNLLGQKLAENWIENEYGSYKYDLDMSFASSGVYIVRLGNRQGGQSKKIIVK